MQTQNHPTTTQNQVGGAAPTPPELPKSKVITAEIHNGTTYFTATRRGVQYTTYFSKAAGEWYVSTHRLALGRMHIGGGRYYKTIGELAQAVKAFAGLDLLIQES
jgi:hypothetical protein